MEYVEVPVIKAHQNIGEMYVGVISGRDLFEMAAADRIRFEKLKIPKYAGYQRALVEERVDSIRDYLSTPRSTLPNAIIVSVDSDYIENWENGSRATTLKIRRERGAVNIIDGQHRAAALEAAQEDFQVVMTIYVDLELTKRAEIFAKINSTQKAVNPSIAFQLFGYADERSPQKTAHQIAEALNTTAGSPFYKRLRMLGTRDAWAEGTLSQSTFAKELMRLYTRDATEDEYRLLRGDRLEMYAYPLRELFVKAEDTRILRIVWRYFFHAAETWPDQWAEKGSILVKTTGYAAFMAVLRVWLQSADRASEALNDKGVKEAFDRIKGRYSKEDDRFVRANYEAGNQGVQKLRNRLLEDLGLKR